MRFIIFRFVVLFIVVYIFAFEYILYNRWKQRLKDKSWFKSARAIYWSFIILTQLPLVVLLIFATNSWVIPVKGFFAPFYYLFISWNYSLFFLFPIYGLSLGLISLGLLVIRKKYNAASKKDFQRKSQTKPIPRENGKFVSRRNFLLLGLDALPFLTTASLFTGILTSRMEFELKKRRIKIKNLHEDLKGILVVHISDLHIGHLIHEEYLAKALAVIENIRADMLIMTGDLIDSSNYYLAVAGRFFQRLKPSFRLGMYGVTGNHDHLDNPDKLCKKLYQSGIFFLRNRNITLKRGSGSLNLLGLDYPGIGSHAFGKRMEASKEFFLKAASRKNPDIPTIVLNHHPMDFQYLMNEKIDLVFSGHTHGGQIDLSPANSLREVQYGESNYFMSHFMEFNRGLYERNGKSLYVNSGIGHWFPLRVNCPPEITLIRLV